MYGEKERELEQSSPSSFVAKGNERYGKEKKRKGERIGTIGPLHAREAGS